GGSGGVRLARWSAARGAKVGLAELPLGLVSEKHSLGGLGGTCVLRGCVPKKLLIYGSEVPGQVEDGRGYGWAVGRLRLSWAQLMRAKDAEVRRLSGKYRELLDASKVEVFQGYARILDSHTVEVGGRRVTARYICVATGSRAVLPEIPGKSFAITSDEALTLRRRPKRIVIVGGGYIAVEFASLLRGLGSEVHLVFRAADPLRGFDEDLRRQLHEALKARGIHLHAGERPQRLSTGWRGKTFWTDKGTVLHADEVMFATGRAPNTEDLGLEEAGVSLGEDGRILVDEFSRSNIPSIFAIGDVTARKCLTPVALMEAVALAETLFGQPAAPGYDGVPSAVFSQPPIATCGLTEEQAAEKYGGVDVFLSKFKPLKHTMPTGRGAQEMYFIKVLVANRGRSAGQVVGVHMVGEDAPEIMQGLAIALKAGASKADFDATVGIHPTAAEELCTLRQKARSTSKKMDAAAPGDRDTDGGRGPPSEAPPEARWSFFDGKESGWKEDAAVQCRAVELKEKKARPEAKPRQEEASAVQEEISSDSDSSSSSSGKEGDDNEESGGETASEAAPAPSAAPGVAAKLLGRGSQARPRACAKMLARAGLRCPCHFSYRSECPGGPGARGAS
ncbi:unnamed protein product, partial [Effrenium voratum]